MGIAGERAEREGEGRGIKKMARRSGKKKRKGRSKKWQRRDVHVSPVPAPETTNTLLSVPSCIAMLFLLFPVFAFENSTLYVGGWGFVTSRAGQDQTAQNCPATACHYTCTDN